MVCHRLLSPLVVILFATAGAADVSFTMHRVGTYRSEAVGAGDFNGDGALDIVAGPFIYLAPDWQPVQIRELGDNVDAEGKGYCDDFANLPLDVDGDGKLDVVACAWFTQSMTWYRNILPEEGLWPEGVLNFTGNFESGELADLDGDGLAREIVPHTQQTLWVEPGELPGGEIGLIAHIVSEETLNFGGGVGDINGDGRVDVLRPDAWFEAPEDPREGEWIKHSWALGGPNGAIDHTPGILVHDVNGDGLNDVVTSSAHGYGIFWYEQTHDGDTIGWVQHTIDDTWTQAHSLGLADIDGDGDLDLVTGKRFMAHNGGDPGAFDALGVYWYEFDDSDGIRWARHAISYDEGIGSGVELCIADLDGDGDPDIIVTGKWGGPVWFENLGER